MSDVRSMSRSNLENQMWDGLVSAWLSCSFALCAIVFSLFWRFQMAEWQLLIRYSESDVVWYQLGSTELFHGVVPPPVPMSANLTGIGAWWFGGLRWRQAHDELRRRRI